MWNTVTQGRGCKPAGSENVCCQATCVTLHYITLHYIIGISKRHLHPKWPVVHQQLHVIRNTAHWPSTQASFTASRVRPKRKISCAAAQIAATQIAATLTISFPRWRHTSLTSYWGQQRMSLTSYPGQQRCQATCVVKQRVLSSNVCCQATGVIKQTSAQYFFTNRAVYCWDALPEEVGKLSTPDLILFSVI